MYFNIDEVNQTFTASESLSSTVISGEIDSSSAFLFYKILLSNNTDYPLGMKFYSLEIGDNLNFISLDTPNNKSEALMLIKKNICPSSYMNMSWHRMVSAVLVHPWALNDVFASLNFNYLNQSLYSNNSYTSQCGQSSYAEASFVNQVDISSCNNGKIQAMNTLPFPSSYEGYINNESYLISRNPSWDFIELTIPLKSINNDVRDNYIGMMIINKGNEYGYKVGNFPLTAHLDFSSVNSISSSLVIPINLLNGTYLNIIRTGVLNYPIDGEVQGDFNMFLYSNTASPVYNLNFPLSPLIVDASVDQTLADFRGKISFSLNYNMGNSNKNLVLCEAYLNLSVFPGLRTSADNLFSLVFVS
ncbi:MAG: hypothetical protein HRT40_11300 [Campylobacteraceae bacterium]|nr:hypothetical protein [Campylobacteraceae bacterium]